MRGVVPLLLLALVLSIGPVLGCSTIVDVAFDEGEDFSRYRTWDWQRRGARAISAPGEEGAALDALLRRLIGRELVARGYRRVDAPPDLWVGYQLRLRRRLVVVEVPRAPYLLSSHHASASYWIEGTDTEKRAVEDARLDVIAVSAAGRVVWQGALQRRTEGEAGLDFEQAVERLLERFPERVDSEEGSTAR